MSEEKIILVPATPLVSMRDRNGLHRHQSGLLWFYGLSGSGKSTIAHAVERALYPKGIHSFVLDGDNLRTRLNRDLGLSPADRRENIRRVAEVGRLMVEAGLLVMAAFITPYEDSRRQVREIMTGLPHYECYVRCSLEVCARRDPKGLYRLARQGKIDNLTGIGAPFEEPASPDLIIDTEQMDLQQSVETVLDFMLGCGLTRPEIL